MQQNDINAIDIFKLRTYFLETFFVATYYIYCPLFLRPQYWVMYSVPYFSEKFQ